MHCILCGRKAGYNRAVIDRFSGAKIGHLCMNCERDEFGNVLEYDAQDGTQCLLCQRDGHVTLPRYVSTPERTGDTIVCKTTIEDGDAPCLCDEHFHAITDTKHRTAVVTR